MSSNLPLVHRSRRGRGGRKLEINIPPQQIHANSKGGLINKGGVMLSEYGIAILLHLPLSTFNLEPIESVFYTMNFSQWNLSNTETHGAK